MKSIAFSIPDFRGGGAERVIVLLANKFNLDGHKVTFIVRSNTGPRVNELNENIEILTLKSESTVMQAYEVKKICKVKQIDIVIGTLAMAHIVAMSKLFGNRSKVISRLGNTLSIDMARHKHIKRMAHYIYQYCLLFSDKLVFQSKYMKQDFLDTLSINDSDRFSVIYNPIEVDLIASNIDDSKNEIINVNKEDVVCVGRLEYQKNYKLTIDVFAKFSSNNPGSYLHVLGDGYQKSELKLYSELMGIGEKVVFHGYQANPYKYLSRAGVYLLTSHYEGFSNSLLEAAYLRLPCVVTDVPGGNREIIHPGINGYIFNPSNIADGVESINKAFDLGKVNNFDYESFYMKNIANKYYGLIL